MDQKVAIPDYFNSLDDSGRNRHESARLILETLNSSEDFKNAPKELRDGIVIGCERGILNKAIKVMSDQNKIAVWALEEFVSVYKLERQSLCEKLEQLVKNGRVSKLLDKSIEWGSLASTSIYKLIPEVFKEKTADMLARQTVEVQMSFVPGLKCKNCGAEKVKDESVRRRSADEASSQYFHCYNCGKQYAGNL